MTIKFHRPVYEFGINEGDIRKLDESQEYMYVSKNFANYCQDEEKKQVIKEKAERSVKIGR